MDVVFGPVNAIQHTFFIFNNSPDVFVKLFVARLWQGFLTIVRTKNDVIENLTVTTHYSTFNWLGKTPSEFLFLAPSFPQIILGVIHIPAFQALLDFANQVIDHGVY